MHSAANNADTTASQVTQAHYLWASCCVFLLNGMGMSFISASTGPCRLNLGADFPPFFPAFSTSTSRHEDKHPPKQFYRPERFSLAVGTAQTRGMRAETQ